LTAILNSSSFVALCLIWSKHTIESLVAKVNFMIKIKLLLNFQTRTSKVNFFKVLNLLLALITNLIFTKQLLLLLLLLVLIMIHISMIYHLIICCSWTYCVILILFWYIILNLMETILQLRFLLSYFHKHILLELWSLNLGWSLPFIGSSSYICLILNHYWGFSSFYVVTYEFTLAS